MGRRTGQRLPRMGRGREQRLQTMGMGRERRLPRIGRGPRAALVFAAQFRWRFVKFVLCSGSRCLTTGTHGIRGARLEGLFGDRQ